MLIKTEAIVLHSFKYGETRMIVDVFTRERGRVSLIAAVPKSAKSRIKKQYFQPMTMLAIEYDERQRVQLQKLKDARLLHPYSQLPFDIAKLSVSLFTAEFLYYALRSEQRNEPLYCYIIDSMLWLDACTSGYANFHLTFLLRMSRFLGFYPNLTDYAPGCCFDLRAGCFTPLRPVHSDVLLPAEAQRIVDLMRMNYTTMHLFRMSRTDRNRCVAVLLQYYRLHIPDFPVLRSVAVLQELFD
ncbi:MAG: DNA repair protein RecO [Prevotella sp.]|nr:DNA repair protein RecO [Prevotella sp.]